MADILLSELETKECGLSVWNQDESNCRALFRPEHTMTLLLADHLPKDEWGFPIFPKGGAKAVDE